LEEDRSWFNNWEGRDLNFSIFFLNCVVPLRVLAFSWKLLRERIPTQDALLCRGVVIEDAQHFSSIFHTTYKCGMLYILTQQHNSLQQHFLQHQLFFSGKRQCRIHAFGFTKVVPNVHTVIQQIHGSFISYPNWCLSPRDCVQSL